MLLTFIDSPGILHTIAQHLQCSSCSCSGCIPSLTLTHVAYSIPHALPSCQRACTSPSITLECIGQVYILIPGWRAGTSYNGWADDDLQGRIKEVVDACEVCAQSKARRGPHPDSCETFPVPSYPFASVAKDFVSLPEVKHPETGVKVDYAIVVMCRLMGYILDIPCKQEGLRSHKAAALFLHYCGIFTGIPREIHSDNPSIISSEFFDALCGLAGISQAKSVVYRPQSNGRAERAVQSIINALRLYLVYRKLHWVYAVPFALFVGS